MKKLKKLFTDAFEIPFKTKEEHGEFDAKIVREWLTQKPFPTCEKCEVFTNEETKTTIARALFCEGLRATSICPKDIWAKEFLEELNE